MSAAVANRDELLAAIECGDVQAIDRALQRGVSPDCELVETGGWRRERSLLYFAAEVSVSVKESLLFVSLIGVECFSSIKKT